MKILISPGYGFGWSTWNCREMAVDKDLVNLFESGCTEEEMLDLCNKKGYCSQTGGPYMGGFDDLKVVEVLAGFYFKIREYDGSESVEILDSSEWFLAEE